MFSSRLILLGAVVAGVVAPRLRDIEPGWLARAFLVDAFYGIAAEQTARWRPLRYRIVQRAALWMPGECPVLHQQVIEGDAGLGQ